MEQTEELIPILMEGFIYIALIAITIYTLIYSYHWFGYGTSKKVSTITLIIFLVGAAALIGTMAISLMNI